MISTAARPQLNDAQRETLALMDARPLRVIAGPGTGKTTTVVAMYLRLLEERGLKPSQVLLLTFANNAAADLKRRIDEHYRESYDESWVSTFHSFATRVLTRFGPLHGVAPFRLMNGFEEKVLMRRVLTSLDGLTQLDALRSSEALVQDALWYIGILKQNLVRSDDFVQQVATSGIPRLVDLAAVYRAYWLEQDRLRLWDFRDVIAQCHRLLDEQPTLRTQLSARFEHVIVDEYQDVDAAQVKLIAQLVEGHTPHPRLAVVGDPNQSIYGFRGTLPAYIDELWQFGGSVVYLSENYRTYGPILDASARLLEHYGLNAPQLDAKRGTPDVPLLVVDREQNAVDEATAVARQVTELLKTYRPADIAVIVRSLRRSGRPLEDALRAAGVPHESGTSPNFATSEVVRFGVAALGALANQQDDALLFKVLESPFAGIPPADAQRLFKEAVRRQNAHPDDLATRSLFTVLTHTCFRLHDLDAVRWPLPWDDETPPPAPESREQLDTQERTAAIAADNRRESTVPTDGPPRLTYFDLLSDAGRDALHTFTWRWARLKGLAARLTPHALAHRLVEDLGVSSILLDPALSDARRAELSGPLRMFLRALTDLDDFNSALTGAPPTLADTVGILEQVLPEYIDELAAPEDDGGGSVRILTVHASKGLEFPVVVMPAMAAQTFPVAARARTPLLGDVEQRWMESSLPDFQPPWPADGEAFLREEARLGYVATTRAKDVLFLSWADEYEKSEPASPSAFLEPLTVAGSLTREYTELHRSPVVSDGAVPDVAVDSLGWEAWSTPITFTDDAYESATSISSFLACPRQYYYGKALRLPSESGIHARRGSAFHAALQEFHRPERERRWLGDEAAARREFDECTDRETAKYIAGVRGKLNQKAERRALRVLFDNYFESEIIHGTPRTTVVTEGELTWHPLDDVTVRGWIDRVMVLGDGHEIIDYKTGADHTGFRWRQDLGLEDKPARDFQLLVYYFGALEGEVVGAGQLRPTMVALWYPRKVLGNPPRMRKVEIVEGNPEERHPRDRIVLDAAELAGRRTAIVSTLQELRAGDFPPTPRHDGYTCLAQWGKGCDYAWVCPGRIEEPEEYEAE